MSKQVSESACGASKVNVSPGKWKNLGIFQISCSNNDPKMLRILLATNQKTSTKDIPVKVKIVLTKNMQCFSRKSLIFSKRI
ncbi:hypothetical protein GJ496_001984 [Pomphorhynchus laevis]|nr:hypothetical protein GJ496_001984 [Pomphorhynchus laevis]